MKTCIIPLLIVLVLAAAIAGGVYLFAQTEAAQSLAANGHAGHPAAPTGKQVQPAMPVDGVERGEHSNHAASQMGALPEIFGHLAIMTIVIAGTLSVQKVIRRLTKLQSA